MMKAECNVQNDFEVMESNKSCIDTGLKYVNNDACYPSLIVVGQIMNALLINPI